MTFVWITLAFAVGCAVGFGAGWWVGADPDAYKDKEDSDEHPSK